MKTSRKLICLICVLTLLLSMCGCAPEMSFAPSGSVGGYDDIYGTRANICRFDDMEYSRPDMDEYRAAADAVVQLLDGGSKRKLSGALDELYGLYYEFFSMASIASIRSDIDTTDDFYAAEYEYCLAYENEADKILDETLRACAASPMCDYLDEEYFDGMLAEYGGEGGSEYTDELMELYSRENSLLSEYRELYLEMSDYGERDVYEKYNDEVCRIYIDLVKLRHQIAAQLGYSDYRDYAYMLNGRDYSPDDIREYLSAIKEYMVPLYYEADDAGRVNDSYDTSFLSESRALKLVKSSLSGLDPAISSAMSFMEEYGLYDIEYSPVKYDGSYETYITMYDAPFLFVSPCGFAEDALTIAHEFGHFCDSFVNYDADGSIDNSETMSQGMEYLLLANLDEGKLCSSLELYKLIDTLFVYLNQACFNEFEEAVYALSDDELSVERINGIYGSLCREYGYGSGSYDYDVSKSWIDISHFFDSPFYVVSYCVSDSAAFMIYLRELEAPGSGAEKYMALMENAPYCGFAELMESCGMGDVLSAATIESIADAIRSSI